MSQPDALFEVSWEVCNMVGGIHTVLSTKASEMQARYGDRYIVVGPDIARVVDDPTSFREEIWMPDLLEWLGPLNLSARMGRWLVPGEPRCLLLNYSDLYAKKDEILAHYWEIYRVDSLFGGWDYYDPVLFAHGVGLLIERYCLGHLLPQRLTAVVQCHEWMAAAAILHLREKVPEIGTVFTTHATTLGRALGSNWRDVAAYREITKTTPAELARDTGVVAKHSMEQVATSACDVFTTVSQITAKECEQLLGRRPDLVLPNGIGEPFPEPELATPEAAHRAREYLLSLAELTTGDTYDRNTTRIVLSSGRYEYVNKGIDVYLDALSKLSASLGPEQRVVAFGFFPAGHTGPRRDLLRARREGVQPTGVPYSSTHDLHDERNDPVTNRVRELDLVNKKGASVHFLFVPVYVDGTDPLVHEKYYELLPGADVSVFPSLYEPWGYTPLESAAFGVPTITTDLTGFGQWAAGHGSLWETGVMVLPRDGRVAPDVAQDLADGIRSLLALTGSEVERLKNAARALAGLASWRTFGRSYLEAHGLASEKATARAREIPPRRFVDLASKHLVLSTGEGEVFAHMRSFTVVTKLRPALEPLRQISRNLRWSWDLEGTRLFEELSPEIWDRVGNDPALTLERVPSTALAAAEASEAYLARMHRVRKMIEQEAAEKPVPDIAYFCMEHGLARHLHLYSGGLGILAGDHLKTASDRRYPLCAIGLAYNAGYFRQVIGQDGRQEVHPDPNDFHLEPYEPVTDDRGAPVIVSVPFPHGPVHARAWRVHVGRLELYLLDTNHDANRPAARAITERLYPSDPATRLAQEIVLGIGGFHLLRALGIEPRVYHMNEGHSAFLVVARIAHLMQMEDLRYEEALSFVRHTTVFTTHTPVAAGHDRFPEALVRPYLSPFERILKKDWQSVLELGRMGSAPEFSTTALAVRGSLRVNGVSERHRRVTQEMCATFFPGLHPMEIPISSVTNGVHVPTWVAPEWQELFASVVGKDWRGHLADPAAWEALRSASPERIWATHRLLRQRLLDWVKEHVETTWIHRREDPRKLALALERLSEDAVVIGFARRFAPYKRATLLLRDVERLVDALAGDRPAILLFSGKAHPADDAGIDLLKEIVESGRNEKLTGRVVFIENYDIALARRLVSGCDVWLNTPTRPLEASGTSGMKAGMNGCLNLSVGDGWWLEGFNGKNGWLLGGRSDGSQTAFQDEYDSAMLYAILKHEVLPSYFDRGTDGIPRRWVDTMKESIISILPRFSSERMLEQYRERYYDPARANHEELSRDGFARVGELVERRRLIKDSWDSLSFLDARVDGIEQDHVYMGSPINVRIDLRHPGLSPDHIQVQAVVAEGGTRTALESFATHALTCDSFDTATSTSQWTARFTCDTTGPHAIGVRALPRPLLAADPVVPDARTVRWF